MLAALDLTNVIDTVIITVPAIIAALYAGRVHHQIQTPSGPSIGEQVEASHVTAIVNNKFLAAAHGKTKAAPPDVLEENGDAAPQMPDDQDSQ